MIDVAVGGVPVAGVTDATAAAAAVVEGGDLASVWLLDVVVCDSTSAGTAAEAAAVMAAPAADGGEPATCRPETGVAVPDDDDSVLPQEDEPQPIIEPTPLLLVHVLWASIADSLPARLLFLILPP